MMPSFILALELARERSLEADRYALARRRELEADRQARAARATRARARAASTAVADRPGRARAAVAWPIRVFSDLAHAVSDAACSAATRIEGSPG